MYLMLAQPIRACVAITEREVFALGLPDIQRRSCARPAPNARAPADWMRAAACLSIGVCLPMSCSYPSRLLIVPVHSQAVCRHRTRRRRTARAVSGRRVFRPPLRGWCCAGLGGSQPAALAAPVRAGAKIFSLREKILPGPGPPGLRPACRPAQPGSPSGGRTTLSPKQEGTRQWRQRLPTRFDGGYFQRARSPAVTVLAEHRRRDGLLLSRRTMNPPGRDGDVFFVLGRTCREGIVAEEDGGTCVGEYRQG